MIAGSLRLRLLAGGVAALAVALAIAGLGLTVLFERHVRRAFGDELTVHMRQLLAGVDVDAAGAVAVVRPPGDTSFAAPLSGLYWQLSGDDGLLLRSRSLWDATLTLPADDLAPGDTHQHETDGPGGARVLVVERAIVLAVHGQRQPLRAVVAGDIVRVERAASAFARDLAAALGLLAVVLALATAVQVALGLRPLELLRRSVARIRRGDAGQLPADVPAEVRPLVDEINGLLAAQEREIARSRGRAADLAHGLKTPLAALGGDIERLRAQGQAGIARDIEQLSQAMSRHVDRELARARARGAAHARAQPATALKPLVRGLVETVRRTPAGGRVAFEVEIADDMAVPLDRTDLAEVLGNLLDNATRHAAARVRVSALAGAGGEAAITIEDDGPGVAPADREAILRRGVRLDEGGGGAGLGLAIVCDVLDAYGWSVSLAGSPLGGLAVTVARQGRTADTGAETGG